MSNKVYSNISWQDDFNTGVDEIDDQHKILLNILNESTSKLLSDNSHSLLLGITQELLAYALYHFETEEALMQQYHYQQLDETAMQHHLQEHRGFSQQVVRVREQLLTGQDIDVDELLGFLYQWLLNHILKVDKDLGQAILARRSSETVKEFVKNSKNNQ